MNDLNTLISSLSSDEVGAFLAFAKAKNQRTDVKNIQLFQLIRKGVRVDLDVKIYGKANKNALHALQNRLKENLVDFTATRGFSSDSQEEMQLFKLVLAARIFLEREQYSIGFKTLKKATVKALSLESYAILQEIYYTHVPYAHLDPKTTLEQIITAYQENEKRYLIESRLVMVYATLQKTLKAHPTNVYQVIKQQLAVFDISIDQNLSFKSLYQLMRVVTDAATLTSDYAGVSIFMNHIYDIVEKKKHLADKHLYYHLEILYLMAGTCFRNKDFIRSQRLVGKLQVEMQKQKGTYKKQFLGRALLLQALNHNYTGDPVRALEEIQQIQKPDLSAQLVYITFLFQQQDFIRARKKMNDFYHSDPFYEKKEGALWVIQKNILEILIYIELQQPDLVASKMRSFIRRFKGRLEDLNEQRVLVFIKLLQRHYDHPYEITEESFQNKVQQAFEWKTAAREDIFVMSFYAYLKAKMQKKPIYEVTLELLQQPIGSFKEKWTRN
ncbi:hypothetical protein F0365_04735 [Nonlabens sp. Ci31]|uniref:hypothetical protein n=1 Tax=Nonlabens sp. Ci31 TaxID=2608253 RepID=UPI001464A43B|nr:hypothetical protein [Nonlabens sp. Ci31]QJP33759.1 hypothetical protein F0365_04735 [Nonlabens sp. Ci31]